MSSEARPGALEKHEDACWLCGRMLRAGYHFVCHVCGATYCYSHMPEKCDHTGKRPAPTLKTISTKA